MRGGIAVEKDEMHSLGAGVYVGEIAVLEDTPGMGFLVHDPGGRYHGAVLL